MPRSADVAVGELNAHVLRIEAIYAIRLTFVVPVTPCWHARIVRFAASNRLDGGRPPTSRKARRLSRTSRRSASAPWPIQHRRLRRRRALGVKRLDPTIGCIELVGLPSAPPWGLVASSVYAFPSAANSRSSLFATMIALCVSKNGGGFMPPAELIAVFRLYGDRCVEIAQELPDIGQRAALLNKARTWFEAANQLEQRGVILGVSLMASQLGKS